MKRIIVALLAINVGLVGCGDDSSPSGVQQNPPVEEGLPAKGAVLRLVGTAEGYDGSVPDIDGDGSDDAATCFDVDILDASGNVVGTATDCLSNITPVGDGMALIGTTIFRLSNGTFTSRGNTTVQPVTTAGPTPITHTTGAVPMNGNNGVLSGTGDFENWQAQVRLAGAVNLSRLDAEGMITFDCLFAVTPLTAGP